MKINRMTSSGILTDEVIETGVVCVCVCIYVCVCVWCAVWRVCVVCAYMCVCVLCGCVWCVCVVCVLCGVCGVCVYVCVVVCVCVYSRILDNAVIKRKWLNLQTYASLFCRTRVVLTD